MAHTIQLPNGEVLTGRSWRRENPLFVNLPFTTNLVHAEGSMGDALGPLLDVVKVDSPVKSALMRMAAGLDNHHPFNHTPAAEWIVQSAEMILAPGNDSLGSGYASAVWALLCNFIVLDRVCGTFGIATVAPSQPVPRVICEPASIGTAAQFLRELTPPTKMLSKFCVAWATRREAEEPLGATADLFDPLGEPSAIALTLSRRLVSRGKQKALMNMTSGLDMLALALTICRENEGVFPYKQSEFQECLVKLGSRTLTNRQVDFLATEAPVLFTGIQHLWQISLAISPILVLSPHSWQRCSVNRVYLCRAFHSLGNKRPQSLITMEDHVLSAAMKLSHGEDLRMTMSCLHEEIKASEDALTRDLEALNWFDLSIRTDLLNCQASQSLPAAEINYLSLLQSGFKNLVSDEHAAVLASPPYTPKGFPPTSPTPQPPSINPQLLELLHLSLREDVPVAAGACMQTETRTQNEELMQTEKNKEPEEPKERTERLDDSDASDDDSRGEVCGEDSNGRDGDSRGENEDDEDAMGVKEAGEGGMEEDHEEGGQEKQEEDEGQEEQEDGEQESEVNQRGMPVDLSSEEEEDQRGMPVDLSSEEEQEQGEQEQDVVEGDADAEEEQEESDLEESDSAEEEDAVEEDAVEEDAVEEDGEEEDKEQETGKDAEVEQLPTRRSARLEMQSGNPPPSYQGLATTQKQPGGKTSKSKPPRTRANLLEFEDGLEDDERPKLRDIGESTRHPTISVDIAGWGSTYERGPMPVRHVPVQIVPPGDVASTGVDAETLRRLEKRVQDGFADGLPPHLLQSARSLTYTANSGQSRFFVAPHSEYINLSPQTILGVLRDRHIIIHGHPFHHHYGWNLDSFARLYDVDKTTTVHAAPYMHPLRPEVRHFQGTLRDVFEITTRFPADKCPPLNAISLPTSFRNLLVPSKWECIATHELAQSRVPASYATVFDIPHTRELTEWSLIGGKDAISSMHIDAEGFGTLILVLEGSKYWIVATRVGDDEDIGSVDSLGPTWDPYIFNEGNNVSRYQFEAVHLQKGDMMIMRPGTLHWVLGTANAICAGRHFYASSTIALTVISLIHTSLLAGALTNESKAESQTLLYQMMHFWSMRISKRDVDGAHIPDISSPVEFFDVVYLGVFIILSRAFNPQFHHPSETPQALDDEIASAESHFVSLIHYFSAHYVTVLDLVMIDCWYIVKRMLAEFAAAVVVFSQAIDECHSQGVDMDVDGLENEGEEADAIPLSKVKVKVDDIISQSYPELMNYYLHCVETCHKRFTWAGPPLTILPRSEGCDSILQLLTSEGEKQDHPMHPIFTPDASLPPPPTAMSDPSLPAAPEKRRGSTNGNDLEAKKRRL